MSRFLLVLITLLPTLAVAQDAPPAAPPSAETTDEPAAPEIVIGASISIQPRGPALIPSIQWHLPPEIPLDRIALFMRIDRGPSADGPWTQVGNIHAEQSKLWEGPPVPLDARAGLEDEWFRLRAFDTGSPGAPPNPWGESRPIRAGGAVVASAVKAPSTTATNAVQKASNASGAKSASGGGAGPSNLQVTAPFNGDGLNMDLSWTGSESGATAWSVLRRTPPEGKWSVLTVGLPASTESFSDKVTSDTWKEPPAAEYEYRVVALRQLMPEDADVAAVLANGTASAAVTGMPSGSWLRVQPASFMLLLIIIGVGVLMWAFTALARSGKEIFIRRIPGIDAIEEGIGRATEMGKPVLYVPGIDELQDIQTIASVLILGQVAKKVAEYQSELIVSCCIPIVREVADEVVRAGFFQAGHPDAYIPGNTRFISSEQFAFCAGTNGIIYREKPATNIYLGRFFAESLILAETGFVNKSIQIAGTAEATQLPFFIAACDYTLIGEELFAVSAYLSKDPRLISSLKASDWIKVFCVVAIVLGTLEHTIFGTQLVRTMFTIAAG